MHPSFASTVSSWQSFYMLAGAASATLVGLLFVAVSLHLDLVGDSGAATILSLARRTFSRFILVVVVALLFLVPGQSRLGLGLPLLALGLADALSSLKTGADVIKALRRRPDFRGAITRLLLPAGLPLVSSVGLVFVSGTALAGTAAYLLWMVPIVAVIMVAAANNSWELMLGLARYKRRAGRDDT